MTRFSVSDVDIGQREVLDIEPAQAIAGLVADDRSVLDAGARGGTLSVAPSHGFVDAVAAAFGQHLPLVFSPDDIWLLLTQGVAQSMREAVAGEKKTIRVRRDDFRPGGSNPWPEVFSAFSEQIRGHIGSDVHALFVPTFSTTGPLERAAAEVVLMGALKNLFTYEFLSLCGIPEVRLLGTPEDWWELQGRAQALCEHAGLGWWWTDLAPSLRAFALASAGTVDRELWRSFYKLNSASGGPYVTGWINTLLPFLERDGQLVRNPATGSWREGMEEVFGGGPGLDLLPSPLTAAPVTWLYLGQQISLEFCAGFVGIECVGEVAVRPGIGWGVVRLPVG